MANAHVRHLLYTLIALAIFWAVSCASLGGGPTPATQQSRQRPEVTRGEGFVMLHLSLPDAFEVCTELFLPLRPYSCITLGELRERTRPVRQRANGR